ncbi:hypothetical protein ACQKNB_00055 [Lysinibacillus xylanilyticus]|uniref:hypothetical protein n=1 Tax=Lysinibacillus xylanilyticus TaxID=582475 RepID=UPI003D023395
MATPWGLANRGTKAKIITSCDNAFVTNIGAVAVATLHYAFAQTKTLCCRYVNTTLSRKKHLLARDPAAKRSGSSDAPSRNGNQSHVLVKS